MSVFVFWPPAVDPLASVASGRVPVSASITARQEASLPTDGEVAQRLTSRLKSEEGGNTTGKGETRLPSKAEGSPEQVCNGESWIA